MMHGIPDGARSRDDLIEGEAKVTGSAIYTWDLSFPRLLHGKLLRSPVPHARIRNIETAAALAMPGVVCIVTGEDVRRWQTSSTASACAISP